MCVRKNRCKASALCEYAKKAMGGQEECTTLIAETGASWHATYVFKTDDPNVLTAIKTYAGCGCYRNPHVAMRCALQIPAGQCLREMALLSGEKISHSIGLNEMRVTLFCWDKPELGQVTYDLKFG